MNRNRIRKMTVALLLLSTLLLLLFTLTPIPVLRVDGSAAQAVQQAGGVMLSSLG